MPLPASITTLTAADALLPALECGDLSPLFRFGDWSPKQGRVQRPVERRRLTLRLTVDVSGFERDRSLTATSRLRKAVTSPRTPKRVSRAIRHSRFVIPSSLWFRN